MKLSILMPVYNEQASLETIVGRVLAQPVEGVTDREVIIVDDGSTDGSRALIERLAAQNPMIRPVFHAQNQGKGASIRSALAVANGEIAVIQDADLEYDPANYPRVLGPLVDGRADCVYGSRFQGAQAKRVLFFWHYAGNKFLTVLCNIFANVNLTDMETGYKAFRLSALSGIVIQSNRFGFEPEITIKLARKSLRMYEVGISYYGRTYKEGKKITWKDGVKAIFTIIRFGLFA